MVVGGWIVREYKNIFEVVAILTDWLCAVSLRGSLGFVGKRFATIVWAREEEAREALTTGPPQINLMKLGSWAQF